MKFLRVASLLTLAILQFVHAQDDGSAPHDPQALLLSNDAELLVRDYSQLCRADNNVALGATPSGAGGGVGMYGPANMNDQQECAHYWPRGHNSWINYNFNGFVTVDRFVIATESECQTPECLLNQYSYGRGLTSGSVRYKNGANQWVNAGSFSAQTGNIIIFNFNSCIRTNQIQVTNLITHTCPHTIVDGDNPIIREWSVCECEQTRSPTPRPTLPATAPPTARATPRPTAPPTPEPTPDCGFDCALDPAVICLPPRFNYDHSRILLDGVTFLQIEASIPKIWDIATTRFVGETVSHGVTDMDVHTTASSGRWHMNASDPCESVLTGLVLWDSLWDNGALTLDSSQPRMDEYSFVFGVDAEREFPYSPPHSSLLEAELDGLSPQTGMEIQRSSNEFPVSVLFETEITVRLRANIISEEIAVVLQSATLTTTRSSSVPYANAELIFSTFVTNPVWLALQTGVSITSDPDNLNTTLNTAPEAIPQWECSNSDPQCRQQWRIDFPLNRCELDHSFDVFFDVHCNVAEFPRCADISKPSKITIFVESPDICPKTLEPVLVTATSKFVTQSGLPTAYFFSDQVVSVRVDVVADAEIIAVEVLDVDVSPELLTNGPLTIWDFSETVLAHHAETNASVEEHATYAIFSFIWSTNLFAPPPVTCFVRERLLITYSSGNKLLLDTQAALQSTPQHERPHNIQSNVAVIASAHDDTDKTDHTDKPSSASSSFGSLWVGLLATTVAFLAM